jgi:hypothetical protein
MPHWMFAIYDEVTGEILGRIRTNSPQVLEQYPHKVDITVAEAAASIEITHKVNIKRLKARGEKRFKGRDEPDDEPEAYDVQLEAATVIKAEVVM